MIQIELLLQNKGRNINVKFPCSESEYQTVCRELELKDNYAFVGDVVEPKALALKKDTFVNLDEINYLARRMDGFDQKELFNFFAAVEAGDYLSTKDLINLTFNQTCYTLIRDVSNLKNIGYNQVLSSKGCIGRDELEKIDLEKIGRELLSSGKGVPTKYGLLFRNEDVAFETLYKGKGFPAYYYTGDEVLGVAIEKDGEQNYIYFPCEETEIDRAVQRIGVRDISECRKEIDSTPCCEDLSKDFEILLQRNDIESIIAISNAVGSEELFSREICCIEDNSYKLAAVMDYAGVTIDDTEKVIRLAENLDKFWYYGGIKNDEELGRELVREADCFIPSLLDKYVNYAGYARDFMRENEGKYTKNGGVVYLREGQTLSEILGENDIKMGGI